MFLVALFLPLLSLAGGPKEPVESSEKVLLLAPSCPPGVVCLGANEKHNGVVTPIGGGAKEYGCVTGPKYCAYFNTANDEFTLGYATTIQPVSGVGSSDFSYSGSTITITSNHSLGGIIDPCEDPNFDYLCFE